MAVLSCFALRNIKKLNVTKNIFGSFRYECKSKVWDDVPVRNCHERTLLIRSSRFEHKKFKDMLNLYILIGIIPIAALVTYINIFIGPATLALIPEGYEPKSWEYHRMRETEVLYILIIYFPTNMLESDKTSNEWILLSLQYQTCSGQERHPITRFIAKYLMKSPHETHERNLHHLFFEKEKKDLNMLRKKILKMIKERQDYQSWYFEKAEVKYMRKAKEENVNMANRKSIIYDWVR